MAESKKVYITTSIFAAFIDRAHPKYEQASAFFRLFGLEHYMLFTDTNTLMQTYSDIYRDISPSLGKDFMRTMMLSDVNILYPEEADLKAALKALVNSQSTDLSYADALVGVLADKRDISQICTFDPFHALFGQTLFYLPM